MAWLSGEGLLRRLMARRTAEPRDPDADRIPVIFRTLAGVYVNQDRALQNDTVWACHRYISQTIGQLATRVMREEADGSSRRVLRHPIVNIFSWRPNPELAPFQLKETLTGWALLWGNGYAEIERDFAGRVVALWPIHPQRVEVMRDTATGRLIYKVQNDANGPIYLDQMDMFHLRGFGDGPEGISVVEYAAQSIGWAQATQLFGAAFFGNGLNHSVAIEGAGKLNDAGQKRLDAQLKARHGGPMRAFKWLFLDQGMKATKTSATPDEAQFIETMYLQVESICRWFGVPPHKVMHLLRATFSNIEHQAIEVVVDSITPWALRWEEEANYKLFGQNRSSFYLKLDLKSLLRGDFKTRQEGLAIQRRNGVINADEWRDFEDMGPIGEDDGGQVRIVEGNMAEIDGDGLHPAVNPAAATKDAAATATRIQQLWAMARRATAAATEMRRAA